MWEKQIYYQFLFNRRGCENVIETNTRPNECDHVNRLDWKPKRTPLLWACAAMPCLKICEKLPWILVLFMCWLETMLESRRTKNPCPTKQTVKFGSITETDCYGVKLQIPWAFCRRYVVFPLSFDGRTVEQIVAIFFTITKRPQWIKTNAIFSVNYISEPYANKKGRTQTKRCKQWTLWTSQYVRRGVL